MDHPLLLWTVGVVEDLYTFLKNFSYGIKTKIRKHYCCWEIPRNETRLSIRNYKVEVPWVLDLLWWQGGKVYSFVSVSHHITEWVPVRRSLTTSVSNLGPLDWDFWYEDYTFSTSLNWGKWIEDDDDADYPCVRSFLSNRYVEGVSFRCVGFTVSITGSAERVSQTNRFCTQKVSDVTKGHQCEVKELLVNDPLICHHHLRTKKKVSAFVLGFSKAPPSFLVSLCPDSWRIHGLCLVSSGRGLGRRGFCLFICLVTLLPVNH